MDHFIMISRAVAAWMQWVHLQPSILSNWRIASVLMKDCHEIGLWRVRKGVVWAKNVVLFQFLGWGAAPFTLETFYAPFLSSIWYSPWILSYHFLRTKFFMRITLFFCRWCSFLCSCFGLLQKERKSNIMIIRLNFLKFS